MPFAQRQDEIGDMARSVEVFREAAVERRTAREDQEIARAKAESERGEREAGRRQAENERIDVVRRLAHGLSSVAEGQLSARIPDPFPAEYEQLRQDFNAAVVALDNVVAPSAPPSPASMWAPMRSPAPPTTCRGAPNSRPPAWRKPPRPWISSPPRSARPRAGPRRPASS
uniref:Methyl-accepting chemotaxis protein n=1 Tax=Phenylobacterium glaciei TaxID=2803784 RepID=A0A974P4D2_9CAUL|nr:methyl-accepting chemotaxis protein [Phenylobacterium glaciei]